MAGCTDAKDFCKVVVHKGEEVPVDGVLLTAPMAAGLAATLVQCTEALDIEKQHGQVIVELERQACEKRVVVVQATGREREAIIAEALRKEQKRSQDLAGEAAEQESAQVLWAAGGFGVGMLVGAVIGAAAVVYFELTVSQ